MGNDSIVINIGSHYYYYVGLTIRLMQMSPINWRDNNYVVVEGRMNIRLQATLEIDFVLPLGNLNAISSYVRDKVKQR